MDLALPKRGETDPQFAHVTKSLRDANGLTIIKANDNPILGTCMYEVEYADGEKFTLSANLIAENTFAQIYEEGNCHVLMGNITDHQFDEVAVKSQDNFVTTSSVTKHRRHTTQGVRLCIKWSNGNTTWVALKDLKEAYPFQLVEYAAASKISMYPTFDWWVPHTLRKRNHIIAKVKSKYWLKTHKFKIKVPNNMNQEIDFDRENGNVLWWEAVCQETKNDRPAFEPWEKREGDIPTGYQEIKCHLILDIKMVRTFS